MLLKPLLRCHGCVLEERIQVGGRLKSCAGLETSITYPLRSHSRALVLQPLACEISSCACILRRCAEIVCVCADGARHMICTCRVRCVHRIACNQEQLYGARQLECATSSLTINKRKFLLRAAFAQSQKHVSHYPCFCSVGLRYVTRASGFFYHPLRLQLCEPCSLLGGCKEAALYCF